MFAHHQRYYNRGELPRQVLTDPHTHLLASLNYILRHYPRSASSRHRFHGLYYGPSSVAYLFLRLAYIFPTLSLGSKTCAEWCADYLALQQPPSGSVREISSDRCGIGAEQLVHTAVGAVLFKDEKLAMDVCGMTEVINQEVQQDEGEGIEAVAQSGSNEWLYGRAGYLYLLRMLRYHFPPLTHDGLRTTIDQSIRSTVACIMKTYNAHRRWTWHGKEYLGAAHGVVGIITQVVMSCRTVSDPIPREISGMVEQLLDEQLDSGNWLATRDGSGGDTLVQFCHGAPGIITSLMSIEPSFPDLSARIQLACSRGRAVTERRGLLKKQPCLCHGITGNALAFDNNEPMMHYLSFTTRSFLSKHGHDHFTSRSESVDEKFGLCSGEAGKAWGFVVAELLVDLGREEWRGKVIGYNDL